MKLIIFLLFTIVVNVAEAKVYMWKDAQGITHFSEMPPASQSENIKSIGGDKPSKNIDSKFIMTSQLKNYSSFLKS